MILLKMISMDKGIVRRISSGDLAFPKMAVLSANISCGLPTKSCSRSGDYCRKSLRWAFLNVEFYEVDSAEPLGH